MTAPSEGAPQLRNLKKLSSIKCHGGASCRIGRVGNFGAVIAGMHIYRWRTDVLTGPYISSRDHQLTITRPFGCPYWKL